MVVGSRPCTQGIQFSLKNYCFELSGELCCVALPFCCVYRILPSQLSCLGSLVGQSIAWKADGHGFKSHTRQLISYGFRQVMLCCFAFLLCCCYCLAFLSISGDCSYIYACNHCQQIFANIHNFIIGNIWEFLMYSKGKVISFGIASIFSYRLQCTVLGFPGVLILGIIPHIYSIAVYSKCDRDSCCIHTYADRGPDNHSQLQIYHINKCT